MPDSQQGEVTGLILSFTEVIQLPVLFIAGSVSDRTSRRAVLVTGFVVLASDRFNATAFAAWRADARVVVAAPPPDLAPPPEATTYRGPSAMFNSRLGEALYAPGFRGGREARRRTLRAQVAPVLFDMLLLAARADTFWPTPGSTMSETVCFWREAWGRAGVPGGDGCEAIVPFMKDIGHRPPRGRHQVFSLGI